MSGRGRYEPPPVDTPEQALSFLELFRERYGRAADSSATRPVDGEAPATPTVQPVTSLPEVRAVVRADDLARYGEARRFADGMTGVEALALRSILELTWAGGLRTVRDLLAERRTELKAELRQLEVRSARTDAEEAELDRLATKIADFGQAQKALNVLIKPHVEAGAQLADEAVRRHPNHPESHFASAMRHRLTRDWAGYGREDRWLAEQGFESSGVKYMRAMAELERGNRPESARDQLEALTLEDPGLVRAQAQLVLLYDEIEDAHAELVQLETISPDHFVVRLAGRTLHEEWETARDMRAARR